MRSTYKLRWAYRVVRPQGAEWNNNSSIVWRLHLVWSHKEGRVRHRWRGEDAPLTAMSTHVAASGTRSVGCVCRMWAQICCDA
jgi:hypothetical protein